MKCGARVALGVAGGYFLGRTRKMKLALMLGGVAAGRRAGAPGRLLAQGSRLIKESPELARLTDEVRGRLLEAGKGAALAVATHQLESLTDRVGKRVDSLGSVGSVGERAGSSGKKSSGEQPPDEHNNGETGSATEEETPSARSTPAVPAQRGGRSRTAAGKSAGRRRTGSSTTDEGRSVASKAAGKTAVSGKVRRPARASRGDGDG